ncbi:hypothetical protein ACLESO_17475 [Pyxidicoccus sp. 3LG]
MNTRQESTRQGRWSELFLGGAAAGVGAPLLLGGLGRFLRMGRGVSPAGMGWTAGVLGALVAGGLARRRLQAGREDARASSRTPAERAPELAAARASPVLRTEDAQASSLLRTEDVQASSLLRDAPATSDSGQACDSGDDVLVADRRRDARRRRRLAVMELRAATAVAAPPASEVPLEPRLRRGPSGREQPWHEALVASTAG